MVKTVLALQGAQVRSLVRGLRSLILYGHSPKNKNTFPLFVKLLNVCMHQVEKALLQTLKEVAFSATHTECPIGHLASQPHLRAEEITWREGQWDRKYQPCARNIRAHLEFPLNQSFSSSEGQGSKAVWGWWEGKAQTKEENTHARQDRPFYQLMPLPSLISWNSFLPLCAFLFPQSPQFPQPTALFHSPPNPLLAGHMVSLKALRCWSQRQPITEVTPFVSILS